MTQDLRYAARALRMRPGFTGMVAVTLSLGIGANAAMFGILDRLLLRPPEHVSDAHRVVQIHTRRLGSPNVQSSQSYAFHKDLREGVRDFESVAVATPRVYYPLGTGPTATRVAGSQVTPSFFATLGVRPLLGRFFLEDEAGESNARKLVVISYGFWQRHFGGRRDAVGATLMLGVDPYTVVGVAPRGFSGGEVTDVDVWLPIAAADGLRFVKGPEWATTRSSTWLRIYARLAPGADSVRARGQATLAYRASEALRIAQSQGRASGSPDSVIVEFGSVIPGRAPGNFGIAAGSGVVRVSRLLGGVSFLVLLLACANVANLLLVRALSRRREIAVRLALGVSVPRLATQLFLEGLLLAGLGAAGALVVVEATSGFLRRLLFADAAWTGSGVTGRVVVVTGALALGTALLTSMLPVLQAARADVAAGLKAGAREGSASRSWTRATLLAAQAALAVVLLAGAGLFIRSLQRIAELPLGVDLDRVVIASIEHRSAGLSNADARDLYLRFADRARTVPGVSHAAVSIAHTFGLGWGARVSARGEVLRLSDQGFSQYAVTPSYFDVMGIRLLQGRGFTDGDREGATPVAIVNETAARSFWPRGDAVGQCVHVGADTMPCTTIVGVVTNARRQQLVEGPVPQLYRPLLQLPASATDGTVSLFGYTLLARATNPARAVDPLRRVIQSTASRVPYANVRTLSEQFGRQTRAWTLGATMFGVFGALAVVIAAVGLYSVVVFTMTQREHEYGVRLALGAAATHLVWITMLKGLAPATIGMVAGTALAMAGGKLVGALLFETSPREMDVYGIVSALLLVTAALACLFPGLRAARTDPAVALRAE